jgi:hypothetical protein
MPQGSGIEMIKGSMIFQDFLTWTVHFARFKTTRKYQKAWVVPYLVLVTTNLFVGPEIAPTSYSRWTKQVIRPFEAHQDPPFHLP